ncbi:nuclear transport factor 2 family protein [Phytomonospora endophytica]|uniref:Putative SnoaL-like aldol condensation-catalyzing enzyme n=1 Tax=Phytomonospora endophytica TaxID=714109 RepID=A0A841FUZ3_9ACTN|nr:ester cyclase [Phytomonospora endophytica]MBB6036329.1 putative SnoaL-like aldol condensation-catalyzing enzyme [Phytomonospora endophytica]GIG67236.1 polyketide cyclase [Phytomonospora endophytica]
MDQLTRNKETVRAFYQAAINDKDFTAARALIGPDYVQHNPRIADGIDGFAAFVAQIAEEFPDLHAEVKALYAEGDHVVGHVHGVRVPGQAGTAIVDIFRLSDGLIVEHWDVMQPVPEEAANGNGMF